MTADRQDLRKPTAAGLPGLLAILLLAAGCAGTPARDPGGRGTVAPPTAAPNVPATSMTGSERGPIAALALSLVGVPYRYGSADPDRGFDCSGLVYYTFRSNGRTVPRTSLAQYQAAYKIPLAQATEGDLVFFQYEAQPSHVGIYLGDGRFVHAPSSGGAVRVESIDAPHYQRHLLAAGRLLP